MGVCVRVDLCAQEGPRRGTEVGMPSAMSNGKTSPQGCAVRKESPSLAGGSEANSCVTSCRLSVRSFLPTP